MRGGGRRKGGKKEREVPQSGPKEGGGEVTTGLGHTCLNVTEDPDPQPVTI